MATENVRIIVSTTGAVTVRREIQSVGNAAERSAQQANLLKNAFAGIFTAAALGTIAAFGDQYLELNNKIKVVSDTTQQVTERFNALYDISQRTMTSFGANVDIFTKSADALKALNYSTQDTLNFTEQLAKAAALGGTAAETQAQGLRQLSQSMAKGKVNGDELTSILENLPYVAKILANELGVTTGALKELGAEGKITAKVLVDAFANSNKKINADFAKITPTISQGLQVIKTGFIGLAGVLETNTGLFGKVGEALVFLGRNMELLAVAVTPVAALLTVFALQVLGTFLVNALSSAVFGIVGMVRQLVVLGATLVTTVIPAFVSFTAALLTNPITLFIIALAGISVIVYEIIDAIFAGNEAWESWKKSASDAVDSVTSLFSAAGLKSLITGGKATITVDGKTAANDLKTGLTAGGKSAGDSVKQGGTLAGTNMRLAVLQGGQNVAPLLKNAIVDGGEQANIGFLESLKKGWALVYTKLGALFDSFVATLGSWWNSIKNLFGAGDKQKTPTSDTAKPALKAYANGGSFNVGGSGGTDSQKVEFMASPNERVTVETPAQQRQNAPTPPVVVPAPAVYNILDPNAIAAVLQTQVGGDMIVNVVKVRREEVQAALGVL